MDIYSSDCGTPPDVYNASVSYTLTTIGNEATYTCLNVDDIFLDNRQGTFVADCYYVEEDVYNNGSMYYVAQWNRTDGCLYCKF